MSSSAPAGTSEREVASEAFQWPLGDWVVVLAGLGLIGFAALSGIAARAPLPVRLQVDVLERPSPTVEAVAYFVASEALTNAARHARAEQVRIVVARAGDVLRNWGF